MVIGDGFWVRDVPPSSICSRTPSGADPCRPCASHLRLCELICAPDLLFLETFPLVSSVTSGSYTLPHLTQGPLISELRELMNSFHWGLTIQGLSVPDNILFWISVFVPVCCKKTFLVVGWDVSIWKYMSISFKLISPSKFQSSFQTRVLPHSIQIILTKFFIQGAVNHSNNYHGANGCGWGVRWS